MNHSIKITLILILLIESTLYLTSCQPKPTLAVVSTTNVTSITQTSATSGGNVTSDGHVEVTSRGICWNTSENATIGNSKTSDGTGIGSFTSNLILLTPGTTYYVRAYATNSEGTGYGSQVSFSTNPVILATLTTTPASSVTSTTAFSGGDITSDGGGAITARGVCWSATPNPTISSNKTEDGTSTGSFTSSITGLTANTKYYFRAYATNSTGTAYGNELTFSTLSQVPTVITTAVTNFTTTSATVGGNVTADGGATVTERGVYWGVSQNPETTGINLQIGSGTGVFSTSLSGLSPNTPYFVKAYANNSQGTSYGTQVSFTTTSSGGQTMTDADGNNYNTVTIGTQVWMAENLKTTKYNDGTAIPNVTVDATWFALTTGAYSDYKNTPVNSTTYGRLYNWYTVDNSVATKVASNGGKNVCPTDWHVPSDAEWTTLTTYLGGESVAGGKLKETGTTHWTTPNTGATNETGFTALPGGARNDYGPFNKVGDGGGWWSSTEGFTGSADFRDMHYLTITVYRGAAIKRYGFSVRCLKDN